MLTRRDTLWLGTSLLVTAALPLPAEAGKKKKGISNSIELVGIESFDVVFAEASDIDKRLDRARKQIRNGRTNLNSALGLKDGTPFADAVRQLKKKAGKKLTVASSGGALSLKASDAVPNNVKNAVSSLNDTLGNYEKALKSLAGIRKEITQVASATSDFPSLLESDWQTLGVSAFDLPNTLTTTVNNLKMISRFPKRVTKLTGDITNNINAVRKAFA